MKEITLGVIDIVLEHMNNMVDIMLVVEGTLLKEDIRLVLLQGYIVLMILIE